MSNQEKNRKPLIVGIVAAVVILAALLALVLTNCVGGGTGATESTPVQTTGPDGEVPTYDLYWNLDRAEYDGKSEAGMSSRKAASDGYYHIRFFINGETVELKAKDRTVINSIDVNDLMGLEFDENGIITGVIPVGDMPCQKVGWQFYVQSAAKTVLKLNSSPLYNGMELMLELPEGVPIYDMTGMEGAVGQNILPVAGDRVYAISNLAGELTHVFVFDRGEYMQTFEAECEHCGEVVTWNMYDKTNKIPNNKTGHYQLQSDIKLTAQQGLLEGIKICLDLNGHTIEGGKDMRVIALSYLNSELAVMDTSEAGTGTIRGHNQQENSRQGIVVFVHKGDFYLYGGTLDASDCITNGTGGAAVYIAADRYFYMYGGEIIGGTAVPEYVAKSNSYRYGNGGAVGVTGKFVMNGGVIRDGKAKSGAVYKNGKLTYQRGMGGNIFVATTGEVEMNGGEIKNGVAGTAGNVFLDGKATFTMNGGTISGGGAIDPGREGGNLNYLTKAIFTMNGGTICGGYSFSNTGNISTTGTFVMNGGAIYGGMVFDSKTYELKENHPSANLLLQNDAVMGFYGGTIYGSVTVTDAVANKKHTTMHIAGYANIMSDDPNRPNLTVKQGKEDAYIHVYNMLDGAKIGVTASGVFTMETDEANLDNFVSDVSGTSVIYADKCLAVGTVACLCGSKTETHIGDCDGTLLVWEPWTDAKSLPTSSGNYYLTCDVNLTANKNVGARDNPQAINLNLNGKTVESADRVYIVYGELNLADHVGGGQLIGAGRQASLDHSGVILVFTNSEMNIYGGTIKLADKHAKVKNGGVMVVAGGATVNLYEGVIDARSLDGEGKDSDTSGTIQQGGAVRLSGTMNVLGGTVYGGTVTAEGGAILVSGKDAKLTVSGGEIVAGNAATNGGAIYVDAGTVELNGGILSGDADKVSAFRGGIIYVDTGAVTIDGATINGTIAKAQAGSIYVKAGTVTMTSGTVNGGSNTSTSGHGGSIVVDTTATFYLQGGVVENGVSQAKNGGNFAVFGTLEISGDAIVRNGQGSAANSKNIYVQNGTLKVSGDANLDGAVNIASTNSKGAFMELAGTPTIGDETAGTYLNLGRTGSNPVPVISVTGALTDGEKKAKILVKLGSTSVGMIAKGAGEYVIAESDKDCFIPADSGMYVIWDEPNNTVQLTDQKAAEPEYRCLCKTGDKAWCDHTQELWTPWDGTTQLADGQNYYLTVDVLDAKAIAIQGKTVKIDLNGHTYVAKERVFELKASAVVSIVDTSYSTGAMMGGGRATKDNGGVFHVLNSTLNLYSGTFALRDNHNAVGNGGVMVVGGTSYVNIYGGTVGNAASTGSVDKGGAINFGGKTLKIFGGTIKANSSTTGIGSGINFAGTEVVIGGNAVIEDIYLPSGKLLTLDSTFDASSARVAVDMEVAGVFAENVATDISGAFSSNMANSGVGYNAAAQTLGMIQAHAHCWCKGAENAPEHTCAANQSWTPIETGKTPFTASEDGYYYLNWSGANAKAITIAEGVHAHLCLNGAELYAGQPIVLKEGSTISICDCSKNQTGKISVSNSTTGSPIRLDGAKTVNLYSGTIIGSERNKSFAAITVSNASAVLNVYGGKLATLASSNVPSGNLAISAGTVNVLGGTISKGGDGNYAIALSGGKLTLGGTVKADGVYLADGQKIVVSEMKETASVSVAMATPGAFAVEGALSVENKKYIASAMAGYQVAFDGTSYALVASTAPTDCLCGEDPHETWCTLTSPVAWTGSGLPTTTGNYYLTAPVTLTEAVTVGADVHIKLWLEGNNIAPADGATIETLITVVEGGSLALVDSTATKGVVSANAAMSHVIDSYGTLIIDGATVDASAITAGAAHGAAVCVSGGEFKLLDGKVIGGKVSGKNGGAVYIAAGTSMTMEDGEISGGNAKYGGNIFIQGTVTIKGGLIQNGVAEIGGNIGLREGGILIATGGQILNGKFTTRGGNISIEESGQATLSGNVTVSGGDHATTAGKNPDRANISLFSASKSGSLTLSDVTLPGGILVANSGKNPVVYLSGKVVVEGDALGLTLGRTGSNNLATIVIGAAGLAADSSVDLTVNNTSKEFVLVDGLSAAQKDAIIANNNLILHKSGFAIGAKQQSDETFDLVLVTAG